jgi:hypothetical protein
VQTGGFNEQIGAPFYKGSCVCAHNGLSGDRINHDMVVFPQTAQNGWKLFGGDRGESPAELAGIHLHKGKLESCFCPARDTPVHETRRERLADSGKQNARGLS